MFRENLDLILNSKPAADAASNPNIEYLKMRGIKMTSVKEFSKDLRVIDITFGEQQPKRYLISYS